MSDTDEDFLARERAKPDVQRLREWAAQYRTEWEVDSEMSSFQQALCEQSAALLERAAISMERLAHLEAIFVERLVHLRAQRQQQEVELSE